MTRNSPPAVLADCGGGPGRIRTFEGNADGFTARSLWPLGHRPILVDPNRARVDAASYRPRCRFPPGPAVPGDRWPIDNLHPMPSFDVVSEVDRQEVRNAVDQASREIANRFDFKNTNSSIELDDLVITMHTASEDRLDALRTVLEEKLVKRGVSLRGVEYGDVQEATQNTVRQVATIKVGITGEKAKQINKLKEALKAKAKKMERMEEVFEEVDTREKKTKEAFQLVVAELKEVAKWYKKESKEIASEDKAMNAELVKDLSNKLSSLESFSDRLIRTFLKVADEELSKATTAEELTKKIASKMFAHRALY